MDFGYWNIDLTLLEYDRMGFDKICDLIFHHPDDDKTYYYVKDKYDKVKDVSFMPNYIKEDWIKYNKKTLDIKTIDYFINKHLDESEFIINELKKIKRDMIINNIL
jgi:hypothetical protein